MILMVLVGLAVAGAFVFAGVGLYFSLAEVMPPWQAGAIVGGAALLAALVLLAVAALLFAGFGYRSAPATARHERATRPASEDGAAQVGRAVGEMMARADIRATDLALGALVAGVVLGAGPRGRGRRKRKRRSTSSEH